MMGCRYSQLLPLSGLRAHWSSRQYTDVTVPPGSSPTLDERVVVKCVVALYNYERRTIEDASFVKGDIIEIFEHGLDLELWLGRVKSSGLEGYIPRSYVSDDQDMVKFQGSVSNTCPDLPTACIPQKYSSSRHPVETDCTRSSDTVVSDTVRKVKKPSIPLPTSLLPPANSGLCCRLTLPCPNTKPVIPFREMEIGRERIELFHELGRGFFGEVYLGKMNFTQDVAIKSMKLDKTNKVAFLREAKAMHALRHSKLVQLLGVCTVGDPMYIITEFMSEGNLLKYVRKDCGKTLKFDHLMDMSSQVAYGMSYLESHKYIHRDLRAANILVGPNNEVKVADFALARLVTKDTNDIYKMSIDAKFPVKWTAPEAGLLGDFSIKSDVWSFGVLLYEVVTYGRVPYPAMRAREVLEKTEQGYRMEKPVGQFQCPNKLYELILNCWHKCPDQRPTFDYLSSYLENFEMSFERSYEYFV